MSGSDWNRPRDTASGSSFSAKGLSGVDTIQGLVGDRRSHDEENVTRRKWFNFAKAMLDSAPADGFSSQAVNVDGASVRPEQAFGTNRLFLETSRQLEKFRTNLFNFIFVEVKVSLSFAAAALDAASHEDLEQRDVNRGRARKGYDTAQRFLAEAGQRFPEMPVSKDVLDGLEALKAQLTALGETFSVDPASTSNADGSSSVKSA